MKTDLIVIENLIEKIRAELKAGVITIDELPQEIGNLLLEVRRLKQLKIKIDWEY